MKARMALLVAIVVIIVGLVPVLYAAALAVAQIAVSVQVGSWVPLPLTLIFTDHSTLQGGKVAPLLAFIPEFRWEGHQVIALILDRIHVGVVFALIGLAIIPLGVSRVFRNKAVMRAEKQRNEDRLRRARDYRRDETAVVATYERREPYIGSRRSAAWRS